MAAAVRIREKRYPLPDFDSVTFREKGVIKAETGGLGWSDFLFALERRDPDAELALLRLTLRRTEAKPDLSFLDDLREEEFEWEDDADPPAGPAEAGAEDEADPEEQSAEDRIATRARKKRANDGRQR